jgi:diguanylate cyclase (GGDEF)-like protein
LLQISADNPELARAQFRVLIRQAPLLYFILLTDILTVAYTHLATAPRSLVLYGSGPLSLVCAFGLFRWIRDNDRELSADQVVRRLKWAVVRTAGITIALVLSSIALFPYGDAYDQGQIAFFVAINSTGCVLCLMYLRPAALVVTFLGVLPGSLFFIASGRPTFVAMGVNMMLVFVALLRILLTQSDDFASRINFQKELAKKHLETLRLAEENSRLANLDVLTELPNRRQFFDRLHERLRHAASNDKRFAVGLVDLDGFKAVNDVYGHVTGDRVLVEAGRRLKDISNESVLLARLGGDEFGVILDDDVSEAEINAYGERICAALRAPFLLSNVTVQIAGSIGFATYPEAGTTAELLFERADYALNHVKQHVRGRWVIFSGEHEIEIRQFASIEKCLRTADLDRELSLNFQPIFNVARREVVAFEALARWDSEELGRVPPDVFIPVAERADFISNLTQILLRKALASARTWPEGVRISFNLSVRDIGSAEAILKIIAIIENSGVAPERIDLEVTETALMRDFDKGCECLKALKALGVHIALDDFGTGYSSLSYVHRLPLDKIKIDRSFIKEIQTQENCRDIVKTMIDLCRNLKLACVIEGMETREQAEILRGLGGTMMQGYYFGRPMPADAIPGFLAAEAVESLRFQTSARVARLAPIAI